MNRFRITAYAMIGSFVTATYLNTHKLADAFVILGISLAFMLTAEFIAWAEGH